MIEDSLTIYKLIVLQMLSRVDFPLTKAQISDFLLNNDYTNFMTLQQVFSELTDAGFVTANSIRNRTQLALTAEGKNTLQFFRDRIGESLRKDIDEYLKVNELKMRNEASVTSDYYKAVSGEYEAHLVAKDKNIVLVDITMSVPTKDMAIDICENWAQKNQIIYQHLVEQLFS